MATTSKSEERRRLETASKLTSAILEEVAKIHALVGELQEVTGGGKMLADRLRTCEGFFEEFWRQRYMDDYQWDFPKTRPALKKLLKSMSDEEVGRRMSKYLDDEGGTLVQNKHPFLWFVTRINNYVGA